ncbi:MAG: hypothetical protein DRP73_05290 [Candidatus Omnitrophota bacterium]|nr:MAG: hypothetical protein DRP73_05290 [Candidatus Omnitrophota bacterium]
MRRIMVVMLAMVTVYFFLTSLCFSETIGISAQVPQAENLKLTLFKLNTQGTPDDPSDDWDNYTSYSPGDGGFKIDFGELELDEDLGIFLTDTYYALDCGVDGGAPWTIQHRVTSGFTGTGTDTLGDNIIVTFHKLKIVEGKETYEELEKTIIADSDRDFTNSDLAGGWLRIYYGIATGADDEPEGAEPITVHETADTYTGTIEITLVTS